MNTANLIRRPSPDRPSSRGGRGTLWSPSRLGRLATAVPLYPVALVVGRRETPPRVSFRDRVAGRDQFLARRTEDCEQIGGPPGMPGSRERRHRLFGRCERLFAR